MCYNILVNITTDYVLEENICDFNLSSTGVDWKIMMEERKMTSLTEIRSYFK